jgi:hypothetical protein
MVQVILSSFALNSASFVYFTAGGMRLHVDKDTLPPSVPIDLNTTAFKGGGGGRSCLHYWKIEYFL